MVIKKSKSKPVKPKPLPASASHFPIVAIGASAGGLEAMMELLKYLPSNTGMAFIYVQHLSPDHKSLLTEILSKKTKMKVQEIDDMDKIKPDNVFIIPYNKGIEVTDGHIKLIPRSASSTAISIDILFSSLAHAQKERVIGIVLSGSASDGTIGIKAIKQEGGLTFAQDDTAKFTSMPHSAIAAGAVDFILSPKEIALELARLSKHPFVKTHTARQNTEDLIDNSNPDLKIILSQLHKVTGVDFSAYKMNTIKRRIIRRMLLYKITTLKEYARLLTQKNEETDILYQDLLINVTSFFRDTDTHKYLKEKFFPKLLKRKKPGETLRIWVPACATGEEAYSIAMILTEIQSSQVNTIPVQIFPTDLSENAISKARIGAYSKQDLETVSPKRIQRFFTKADGGFRVNKVVRDMCVFAPHNILRDPPFSRLDFISCCNLFIYLDIAAQKKAVNTFHYALNNDGYLMLGKSENISHSTHLFTNANNTYKIFSRKLNSGALRLPELLPRFAPQTGGEANIPIAHTSKSQNTSTHHQSLDNAIDAVLVSEFMPASVVINHQLEIVQFRGNTDLYLTHPKGKATFNILKMARPEIAFELRNAISKVIKTKHRIRKSGIELKINSIVRIISVEVVPLKIDWNEPLLLILFTEQEPVEIYRRHPPGAKSNTLAKDRRIKKLEEELAAAHADALALAQEQEAFTEELQSANEEVVSSNEELQTVNEELETSKEEIESANEELTTTNQELQTRNDLLNESYEYSNAIVATMHEPMLVLGKDLRVKSANTAFYKKFGVTEEQTEGVLLYDLGNKQWNIPALRELLEDIIPKNTQFYNYEVKHTFLNLGEKIMSLNASRVIQKTHREQLILLVIADITEVRHLLLEKELKEKALLNKEITERKAEKVRLETAVAERTRELKEANEALEDKNQELVNMNHELEAFTYISSHDMQEPLRKIQIFSGIILEKENQHLSDSGKKYFRLMQQSAQRMQQLIHDLLAFSRLSATERKFEEMNLCILIEEVKAEFSDIISEKQARIDAPEMCSVNIIPFQFRQLLHNLIGNALKFSNPERPPHIKLR
ncbi:MAG TPA: chemotaxis protein CheB, partial [Saprospiraceae bacterium]|nr:chemotaxis protein CheB [Saprospiraceae bacterium]